MDNTGEFVHELNDCFRGEIMDNGSKIMAMIASVRQTQKDFDSRLRSVEEFAMDYRSTSGATAVHIEQQTHILRSISMSLADVRDRLARLEGEKTGQFYVQTRPSNRPKEQPALQITVGKAAQIGGIGASVGGVIMWLLQRLG